HEKYPDAIIFINGSYYDENRRPTTAIWQDGKCINRKKGILNKGALFSYTVADNDKGTMDLIYLGEQPVDVTMVNYYSAIQSMPTLIVNGRITVKKSDWKANRTVIAKDKNEYIYIIVSEGSLNYKSFSLYDMADWIIKNIPNIIIAVNLDGGYESQLSINTEKLKYATLGQWETNDTGDISKPGIKIKIPVAIGFFKKMFAKDVR
ncbi:MAG: phosphodiester glycosidase family protein, partial [Candidatus Goldbacteria bacterium]|nr:phosphodiester glycosidase family protein [Candidatus Goldiibacteriota bacterium]